MKHINAIVDHCYLDSLSEYLILDTNTLVKQVNVI